MKIKSLKIGTVTLLCVSVIFFTGCGATSDISHGSETAGEEQAEKMAEDETESSDTAEATILEEEEAPDSTDAENEEASEEENPEKHRRCMRRRSGIIMAVFCRRSLQHGSSPTVNLTHRLWSPVLER